MNTYSSAPATAPARSTASAFGPLAFGQLAAAGLVIVGAFGTWASVSLQFFGVNSDTVTINGIDGGRDGVITLTLAIVAAALVLAGGFLSRSPGSRSVAANVWTIGPLLCFTLSGAIAGYDWVNISRLVSVQGFVEISVGWGLILTLVASIVGLIVSVLRLRQDAA